MNANVSIKVTLPAELAEAMRVRVEAGEYSSAEDMLKAGVEILIEQDRALDRWLREEVITGHADYLSHPDKALDADDILTHLRDRRAGKSANG